MYSQHSVNPGMMGLILSIASCIIISFNLLVAFALLRLLLKKRSQSWCFVLNLALADALVGVAITGLASEDFGSYMNSRNVTENELSPISPLTNTTILPHCKSRCLVRMAFVMAPCTASILSMFLISLDRYAAIKKPLRYSQLSGKLTVVGSLLALWISSFTVGFLPGSCVIVKLTHVLCSSVMVPQLQTDSYDGFCAFFSVIHPAGIAVLFSLCFFPLLSAFVFIYLDILKIACSHQKKICQVRHIGSRTADHHGHQQNEHQHQRRHHHHQQQQHQHQQLRSYWGHFKAIRTVTALVGCLTILWSPFFVVCIVQLLCKSCQLKVILENHLWLLGLSNSLINPVVYAFSQREVRLQLAAMFCCSKGRSAANGPPGATKPREQPNMLTPAGVPERP